MDCKRHWHAHRNNDVTKIGTLVKSGIIKKFFNAVDVEKYCFNYIYRQFPKLRKEKLKDGNIQILSRL